MKNITSKNFIKEVLTALEEKGIGSTKIFLHKFVYFLTLQNYVKVFRFEPYTYGPFSFTLAREVESLAFWDEVEVNGNTLTLLDDSDVDASHVEDIKRHIDTFAQISDNNFSFDNLERIGTVLYCMEALKNQGADITLDKIIKEFHGWKGNKYPERQIEEAFNKINAQLPSLLQ